MNQQEITANVLFSGIGFQEWGFDASPYRLHVLCTAEIDRDAILSYACIHHGLDRDFYDSYKFPEWEQMVEDLSVKNIGYNPKEKQVYDWIKCKKGSVLEQMKQVWLADKMNRNLGDISRIESLPKADLWFSSFPCQSISSAGKMRGFKPGSGTRSSLLWENIRLLKHAVETGTSPKVIMFENVKALVSKRYHDDYISLLDILSVLGYQCFWRVLNAKECGVPQNRERVFIICIRKDICPDGLECDMLFPKPFKCSYLLEDILDPDVDIKYYINQETQDAAIQGMIEDGSLPEAGEDEEYHIRRLTPQESFMVMGMPASNADKCMAMGVSETALCKQAGNGIVSDCVMLLAEHLYKVFCDPDYECRDEVQRRMQGYEEDH